MKYAVAVALLALAGTAGAQVNNAQVGGANAAAAAQSGAVAGSQSGAGAAAVIEQNFNTPAQQRIDGTNTIRSTETIQSHIDTDINYSGKYTVRNTPNVAAPNILPTSPCMGSTSVGVGFTGFGFSGGTSWKDDDCGYRETARVFLQAGMPKDGLAVLCASPYAAEAPSCKALKPPPAAAPAKTSSLDAKETMIRDMNDGLKQTTLSKSQWDTAVTKAAMQPTLAEQKAANCRLAADDQFLRGRFGCDGIYTPVVLNK